MKPFSLTSAWLWLPCLAPAFATAQNAQARGSEGERRNSVLLNGAWEFSLGTGDEGAEAPRGQRDLSWKAATLPGAFMPWNQEVANQNRFVWARRTFKVSVEQAANLAVLRWNRIANGAVAFVNARKVGENEPTGPYQGMLPAGVLKSGEKQIVLKIRGAAAVRRSRSGNPLIPAGFGVGMPEVTDDVWIDFADRAYLKWALAVPDLAGNRVRFRVTPTGPEALNNLTLVAEVQSWPDGKLMGSSEQFEVLSPSTHTVVIWNASRLNADEKRQAGVICEFAARGGRVVVLATPSWDWTDLCRVEKILWAREPNTTVMARVPAAAGNGFVLFSQLNLQERLDPARPSYDPVAERVLLELLKVTRQ